MGGGALMFHGVHGVSPYIGPVGGLRSIHGLSASEVTIPTRYVTRRKLSGRVQAQRAPRPRREWSASISSAYPEHVAYVQMLESSAHGLAPLAWYDEMAQVTNILTPAASLLESGTWSGGPLGGSGITPDGVPYTRSVVTGGGVTVTMGGRVPVPYGSPVVVSAYLTGLANTSGRLTVTEYDPEGVAVGSRFVSIPAEATEQRFHIALTASQRTATIEVTARNILMVTLPAITLTADPMPWATGRGCTSAIVQMPRESVAAALRSPVPGGRRAGYSFTITELG